MSQLAAAPQHLDRAQLRVCGAARTHQIRVIGIRESVRARPRRGHDGRFLKHEHGVTRAGCDEHVRDRFRPLRIGDGMVAAVEYRERRALAPCDLGRELRPGDGG